MTKKKGLMKELTEDVILIVIVLAAVFVIKHFLIINAVVPSGSMEDTIMVGDRVFGNRLSYRFGEPERGDIVIFKYPDDEEQLFIKRLIGLPGEKVDIRDGLVYINDSETPLEEPYVDETPVGDFGPYQVPEDCYFMLGDNRNYSRDARFWEHTYVTREQVQAKAGLRYYPFNKFGMID